MCSAKYRGLGERQKGIRALRAFDCDSFVDCSVLTIVSHRFSKATSTVTYHFIQAIPGRRKELLTNMHSIHGTPTSWLYETHF